MRRPIGVWLICFWCAVTVFVGTFGLYALAMKFPSTQTRLFSTFGTVDFVTSILYMLAIGLAGVFLFNLRRPALWSFIGAAVCKAALDLWQFSSHGFWPQAAALQPFSVAPAFVISWVLVLAATVYVANLRRNGKLT